MRYFWTLFLLLWTSLAWAGSSLYDLQAPDIDGEDLALDRYRGQVTLVVNTASMCGYTPQYKDLEALYRQYKDQGFTVLAFPSNDFNQEYQDDAAIKDFCEGYQVTFPLFASTRVRGGAKHPIYQYLTEAAPGGKQGEVRWNFEKFLVDQEGNPVGRFDSSMRPNHPQIISQLEALLNKNS